MVLPGVLNPVAFYKENRMAQAKEDNKDITEDAILKDFVEIFFVQAVNKFRSDIEVVSSKMVYQHAMETYSVLTESNQYTRKEYLNLLDNYKLDVNTLLSQEKTSMFQQFQDYLKEVFTA